MSPSARRDPPLVGSLPGRVETGSPGVEFLASAALDLSDESLTERELNSRVAERILAWVGDGVVAVSSFHREMRTFRIEALAGDGDRLSRALKTLGRDPMGLAFEASDDLPWSDLSTPVLNPVPGGIHDLFFRRLAPEVCGRIEKLLGISEAWVMGLGHGSRLFGTLAICLPPGATIREPRVIEALALLATLALRRRRAQDERRVALGSLPTRETLPARREDATELTAQIMDNSAVGILVLDPSGRIEFANRRAQGLLGVALGQPRAAEGAPGCLDLSDHEGRPLDLESLPSRQVMITGRPVSGVRMAFRDPNGRRTFGVFSASPLLGPSGDIERVIETIEDVTRDVEAQRRIKDSGDRFQRIVDDQVDLICRFLPDGTLTFVNPAFCNEFGQATDVLLGSQGLRLVHPEDRDRLERHVNLLTARRPVGTMEHRMVRSDGRVRWLQWTTRGTFDEKGAVVEYQAVGRDVTERKEAEDRLAWLATHDAVTGLPNRLLLQDRLSAAMARSARNERLFAVALLDLDRFKEVNDQYGHAVGDTLLKTVGERLKRAMRRSDTVARVGGDEFTMILSDLKDIDSMERFSRKILSAFGTPFEVEGLVLNVTASIGIAIGMGLTVDGDILLRRADRAMYQAKRAGRNAIRLFEDVPGTSIEDAE